VPSPRRNADAPTTDENGSVVFAKPHEEDQEFSEFLSYVIRQEKDEDFPPDAEIRYAQTRKLVVLFSTLNISLYPYGFLCQLPLFGFHPLFVRFIVAGQLTLKLFLPQKTITSGMNICHSSRISKRTSLLRESLSSVPLMP
jgi:hypothetical protein